MKLIKFDENNDLHLKAFNYFTFEAGHPEYFIKGEISDFDFEFRELIAKKFKLDPYFIDEPNGSFHQIISRNGSHANFKISYGYLDEEENDHELSFDFEGELFFNEETDKVVLEPNIKSIVKL